MSSRLLRKTIREKWYEPCKPLFSVGGSVWYWSKKGAWFAALGLSFHSGGNYFNGKLNPTGFSKPTVDFEVQILKLVPVHYITCHKLECWKEEWSDVNRKREISGWRNLSLFLFGWTHERNSVMKETLGRWVSEVCEVFAAAINKLVHQREKFINFAVNYIKKLKQSNM